MLPFLTLKTSARLQSSKSTPKGDILFIRIHFSRTTTKGSFGLQHDFFSYEVIMFLI